MRINDCASVLLETVPAHGEFSINASNYHLNKYLGVKKKRNEVQEKV